MRAMTRRLVSVWFSVVLLVGACGSATQTTPQPLGSAPPVAATSVAAGGIPPLVDMPFYRGDAARSAIQPGPGPAKTPTQAWQHPLGPSHFLPILVDGLVIAGAKDGTVLAVDARTGQQRWQFKAGGPVGNSAAAANGLVFVGDTHSVFGLDAATGIQKWVAEVPSKESRPVVVDGVVYTASIGGVVGLDGATGTKVWQWTGPKDVAATVGPIADGVAYVMAGDGRLYAIDIKSSTERWHVQTISTNVGYAEVVGKTVYVATTGQDVPGPEGELYAIERASGAIRWRFRTPSGGQINAGPVKDGIIYANAEQDGLYALRDDRTTATALWRVDTPRSYWPPALVGDSVYQQRADGSIGVYATSDGHLQWETTAPGDEAGGPLVSGGMVFQVQDNHGLAAYATSDLIAQLPSPEPQATISPTPALGNGPFVQVHAFSWTDTGLEIPLGMDVGPDGLLYVLDVKPSVTVIDPDSGHVVRTWGRSGTGPGEFDLTRPDDSPGNGDIAVAPDGKVYVADGTNHRIQVFKANGTFVSQFGSFGTGPGQFGNIDEVEVASDGSVYVVDNQKEPLSKFTSTGKFSWRLSRLSSDPDAHAIPHGVAVRSDGSVLMSCEDCGHILVIDPATGRIRQRFADVESLRSAGMVNLDPKGNIYVAQFFPVSELVLDSTGRYLDGLYHMDGTTETYLGRDWVWGDVFWPSPLFMPDGRAFSFGRDGLIELKVKLP
jgi:outer membrane protein assembly factor BamB